MLCFYSGSCSLGLKLSSKSHQSINFFIPNEGSKKGIQKKSIKMSLCRGLGTIQVFRNQNSGWVRPNAYLCLYNGWVGIDLKELLQNRLKENFKKITEIEN